MLLLKFEADYADEFDVYGIELVSEKQWEWTLKMLDTVDWPHEKYFGTNEALEFESKEDFLRCFKVITVNDDEASVITKLFGNNYNSSVSYGTVPEFEGSDEFYKEYGRYPK